PTSATTCAAIHGTRAVKLPVTEPWTAKTPDVARRAERGSVRTARAYATRVGSLLAADSQQPPEQRAPGKQVHDQKRNGRQHDGSIDRGGVDRADRLEVVQAEREH